MSHDFAAIDAKSINEVFKLSNEALPRDKIITASSKDNLKDALSELCIDEAEWNVRTSRARTLSLHW